MGTNSTELIMTNGIPRVTDTSPVKPQTPQTRTEFTPTYELVGRQTRIYTAEAFNNDDKNRYSSGRNTSPFIRQRIIKHGPRRLRSLSSG